MTGEPILRGTFAMFPLADVFSVLALSRQLLGVRFSDESDQVGTIVVKAGHVLGAEDFRTRTRGADALKGLVNDPGRTFTVVELSHGGLQAQSVIGRLGELLPRGEHGDPRETDVGGWAPSEASVSETVPVPPYYDIDFEPPELRIAEPSDQSSRVGEVILRGGTADSGFDELLEVLQLGAQHLRISFIRGDAEVGSVHLESEQVLAATAGPLRGTAAFKHLYADNGETFEVRRLVTPCATEALGSIDELLAEARRENLPVPTPRRRPPAQRVLFMQGRLSDFPLEVLVSSLALCRQPIELVLGRKKEVLHRVLVKAGRITAVANRSGGGVDTGLAAIRRDPGTQFFVYRRTDLKLGPPVAPLTALVRDTDAVPGSDAERPAPPAGTVGASPVSRRRDDGEERDDLSDIKVRLEQITSDMEALRLARERMRSNADRNPRAALADATPNRGERRLLRCILALQLVTTLAVAVGLFMLVTQGSGT